MLYVLYKVAEFLINIMPLKASYWLACRIGDVKYFFSVKDKAIISNNLKVVLGEGSDRIQTCTRDVFRNFCKYLVDFLRQHRIDKTHIGSFVKVKGTEHIDRAFKKQKGIIILSAHLGNWELGAVITALLGYPLNVIALSHKNKRVNRFFDNRRQSKGVKVIPLGGSVKKAFSCLARNEAVAILADRDFSKSDLIVKFFGRDTIIPKGVGIFKVRRGASIVPCFVVREPDNTYSLIYGKEVEHNLTGKDSEDIKAIVQKSIYVLEDYIRKYPGQWFMFDDLWSKKKI